MTTVLRPRLLVDDRPDIAAVLRRSELLRGASDRVVGELTRHMDVVRAGEGSRLYREERRAIICS